MKKGAHTHNIHKEVLILAAHVKVCDAAAHDAMFTEITHARPTQLLEEKSVVSYIVIYKMYIVCGAYFFYPYINAMKKGTTTTTIINTQQNWYLFIVIHFNRCGGVALRRIAISKCDSSTHTHTHTHKNAL